MLVRPERCPIGGLGLIARSLDAALPREIVEQAVEMIITRFIPLKPSDLERWEQDPEEFLSGEKKEDDVWEFDIRVRHIYLRMWRPF